MTQNNYSSTDLNASNDCTADQKNSLFRSKGRIYKFIAEFRDQEQAHLSIMDQGGFTGSRWKEGRKVASKNGATHW